MNQQFLHFTFFLWVCLTLPLTATAQVVAIPDPNLRAAIETELGKASGATITADDMAALTRLEAPEAGISNLTGLESATNLTGLYLESNAITDISVLAGLPNLTRLALGYNAITDHSILSGLTNLTFLDLRTTNTSDLSVLSGLIKLERLFIDRNGISDLSALAGLTNLMDLALNDNSISDLSDLKGLINLKWMRLAENNITDLSPLVANTGLGSGDQVLLNDNPLNYSSIKTHIPILQSRGVTVEFDNRTPATLLTISGVITELNNLLIVEVRDSNGLAFEGVWVTFTVTSGGGTLSVTHTTTDADGRAESRLTLGSDGGSNTVRASVEGIAKSMIFSDVAVTIPDPNLRVAVEIALGKAPGTPIAPSEITTLTRLEARNANISDLTGLEGATNLKSLFLDGNNITDISVVTGLTNLTALRLDRNSISDISALSSLTQLKELRLDRNNITDLSPLVANTGLGSGDQILLNDNPLSYLSLPIHTHIPALQSRGVTVEFDDRTHLNIGEPHSMRLIYFLPNDRQPRPNIDIELDTFIKEAQQYYANVMEYHGFGRKTFRFETDVTGKAVVHHVKGRFDDAYYQNPLQGSWIVWEEIEEQFDTSRNIFLLVLDNISENLPGPVGSSYSIAGLGSGDSLSGKALVPSFDPSVAIHKGVTIHELGHAFGLMHDSRFDAKLASGYRDPMTASFCSAQWLEVHRYFNTNQNAFNEDTSVQMFTPSLAAPPHYIRLRFEVADPDGLHQAQLFKPFGDFPSVIACKHLNGKSTTVEFITTELIGGNDIVLRVIDAYGNFTERSFPIDITPLLPSPEVISIPDPNLAAVIRETLGMAVGEVITQFTMLNVDSLNPSTSGRQITNLTGIEHATNIDELILADNQIRDITPLAGLTKLSTLFFGPSHISDISPLAGLTNLEHLRLRSAQIGNIAPLAGLTKLESLYIDENPISDITPLAGLTNLQHLRLSDAQISNITPLAGLTKLESLFIDENPISDITPLAGLTNLQHLKLSDAQVSNITPLAGLTELVQLELRENQITDITPLAKLTNLTWLNLEHNLISDISPLVANTGLRNGNKVDVKGNPLSYLSIHTHIPALQSRGVTVKFDDLTYPVLRKISGDNQTGVSSTSLSPFVVEVQDENGSVLGGISVTFAVTTGAGTLSVISTTTDANGRAQSTLTLGPNLGTNTVEVSAAGIQGSVSFQATSDALITEYLLSVPVGISFIHVPLKVTTVDGMEKILKSIADLYDALGGADTVNFLITYDPKTQVWRSYLGNHNRGTVADTVLANDTGIIAVMNDTVSVRLGGDALGSNGSSSITLHPGANLVGIPLRDSRIARVTDLFALDGIRGKVRVITVLNNGAFHTVGPAGAVIVLDSGAIQTVGHVGDASDIPITGGQSFILTAQEAATVAISGGGWYNISETTNILPIHTGIEVEDTTPVLVLRGSIVDQGTHWNKEGFHVTVKNLSTGKMVTAVVGDENVSRPDKGESKRVEYQLTIVDTETGRAAMIGDILEISVQSPGSSIGVESLRYVVTAEDVLRSHIQFGELVVYEISWETELLQNYPNPFTPETWIPYRLAEDASVTLTIYDLSGHVVRTLNAGHRIAAAYESESKAIYWNGRNDMGERVASGVYFYTLTVGHYSDTRKMVILR